jgi:hypothetical protein
MRLPRPERHSVFVPASLLPALIWTVALFLASSSASAHAQTQDAMTAATQTDDAMKAQASPANIQAWLQSKDPRFIAWGAYFARENNDAAALDLASQLVNESLYKGGLNRLSTAGPQHEAMLEILDALIERNTAVSADTLSYLWSVFPVQSAILASRLPAADTTSLLMQWYYNGRENPHRLSRVAAMLLAKSPPPGFAASILTDSEELLSIMVVSNEHEFGGSGSMSSGCSDGGSSTKEIGWPELFSYQLEENDSSRADLVLVEAGGDRITWQRLPGDHGWGSCYGVRPLSAETRHHLLSEMLGVPDSAMPWPTRQNVTIVWRSKDQFQQDLGAAIEAEDAKLQQTVQAFQSSSLITPQEATTVIPRLTISIKYSTPPKQQE